MEIGQSANLSKEIRIALVGKTGVGKSATGNTIVGENVFKSMLSTQPVSNKCEQYTKERFDRRLQVVDIPAFLDIAKSKEDAHRQIAQSVVMLSPGIHAILFVVRIGRFTEEDVTNVKEFIQVFGEGSKEHVIVVFTGADDLEADDMDLETFIEESSPTLKTFLEDVKGRVIAVDNRGPTETKDQFVKTLLGMIDQMLLDNNLSYYPCQFIKENQKEGVSSQFVRNEKESERSNEVPDARTFGVGALAGIVVGFVLGGPLGAVLGGFSAGAVACAGKFAYDSM